MAKAKRDLEKTEAALAADTEFLANMKKDFGAEDYTPGTRNHKSEIPLESAT